MSSIPVATTRRELFGRIASTSTSQVVALGLTVAASLVQAQALGAEGRGDLARFLNAGALLLLLLGFGIGSSITYYVAASGDRVGPLAGPLVRLYVWTLAIAGSVVAVVALTPMGRLLPHDLSTAATIGALTIYFGLSQGSGWLSALLTGSNRFVAVNASAIAAAGLAAAGSLVLATASAKADVTAFVLVLIGAEVIRATILGIAVANTETESNTSTASGLTLRAIARYSALSYIGDFVQFFTYRLDMWIVDATHGGGQLGVYAVSVSLAQLVWIVPSATARVIFPISAMVSKREAARLAWQASILTFGLSFLLGITGWLAGSALLPSLLGHDFADLPSLLAVLLVGTIPYSVAKVLGNYLAGRGAVLQNVMTASGVLVITIALDLALIPAYGALGAAWASAASYIAYTIGVAAFAWREGREQTA
jgi:O-antigen/teichoic acid export membrane protein